MGHHYGAKVRGGSIFYVFVPCVCLGGPLVRHFPFGHGGFIELWRPWKGVPRHQELGQGPPQGPVTHALAAGSPPCSVKMIHRYCTYSVPTKSPCRVCRKSLLRVCTSCCLHVFILGHLARSHLHSTWENNQWTMVNSSLVLLHGKGMTTYTPSGYPANLPQNKYRVSSSIMLRNVERETWDEA